MRTSASRNRINDRAYFRRPTKTVARDLIGTIFCVETSRGLVRSRVVETEAYLGTKDEACHSFKGKPTPRTEVMYGDAGHAYVYFIYGMYFCFNVVTLGVGEPEAVLLRAVEPIGEEDLPKKLMRTNGPGKLATHLEITRADNGLDLCSSKSRIWFEARPEPISPKKIVASPRIGIESKLTARDLHLRYHLAGNPFVSRL